MHNQKKRTRCIHLSAKRSEQSRTKVGQSSDKVRQKDRTKDEVHVV